MSSVREHRNDSHHPPIYAVSRLPSFSSFCERVRHHVRSRCGGHGIAYQSLHVAVKSMPVVAAELGVGTLERRVSCGLGLLDTIEAVSVSSWREGDGSWV